jgi:hypothetical protein
VTATNADGKASATSGATDPVNSADGPSNTVRPAVNGTWSPTPTSFTRQWQQCNSDGASCLNIAGATGQTYGVRSGDAGHRLRALVTAHTSSGQTTVASTASGVVGGTTTTTVVTTTTTSTTTTVAGNKAPSLQFLSLRVIGARAYARFRVCDDRTGHVTVIARDNKNRVLARTHRFHVTLFSSCNAFSRHWLLARAFRTPGRYVATLRAVDAQGRLSLLRSRPVILR